MHIQHAEIPTDPHCTVTGQGGWFGLSPHYHHHLHLHRQTLEMFGFGAKAKLPSCLLQKHRL